MSASLDLPSGLVTFLFTDIEGSTRLAQLLGAQYRPVLAEHRQILRRALGAGDGVALFTEGDSVFAAFPDANAAIRACAEAQRALARHDLARPAGAAPGPDGPALRLRRAGRRRVRHARGAPGRPGRLGRPRRSGALLGRDRPAGRPICRRTPSLLDLGPVPAARLRRPGTAVPAGRRRAGAQLPPPADAGRGRPQPARPGGQLRRPGRRDGASCAPCSAATGWSTWSAPAVPARPGWPSRWPARRCRRFADGVWFVDLAAVTDPYLVAVAVAEALGVRPEPGRPILETIVDFVAAAPAAAGPGHLRRPPERGQAAGRTADRRRAGGPGAGDQPGAAGRATASWSGASRRWA